MGMGVPLVEFPVTQSSRKQANRTKYLTAKVQPGTKAAKSWATNLVKVFEFQIDLSKI